jgi:hypothetical protein
MDFFWNRRHPDCDCHPSVIGPDDYTTTHPAPRACERCLLLHILERLLIMPTQADVDAAVQAGVVAFNTGFDALEVSIATEVTKINASVAAAVGVIPQSTVDAINAATANITAKLTKAQTDVAAEIA